MICFHNEMYLNGKELFCISEFVPSMYSVFIDSANSETCGTGVTRRRSFGNVAFLFVDLLASVLIGCLTPVSASHPTCALHPTYTHITLIPIIYSFIVIVHVGK